MYQRDCREEGMLLDICRSVKNEQNDVFQDEILGVFEQSEGRQFT